MAQKQIQQPERQSTSYVTWSDFMASLTDLNYDGQLQYTTNKVTLNGVDVTEHYKRFQASLRHSQAL